MRCQRCIRAHAFLQVGTRPDCPAVILPAVLLIGLAFGLGFSSLSLAATAGVADAEQGLAASLFQTSFQVGGAIVLAVVTAVVDAGGANKVISARATLAPAGRTHPRIRHTWPSWPPPHPPPVPDRRATQWTRPRAARFGLPAVNQLESVSGA